MADSSDLSLISKYKLINLGVEIKEATKSQGKERKMQVAERNAPIVSDFNTAEFGDMEIVQSRTKSDRKWADIGTLDLPRVGESVWIRARVHTVRAKGSAGFLLARRGFFSIQCVMFANGQPGDCSKDLIKFAGKISPESVVDIHGVIVKAEKPVTSASQSAVEVSVKKLFVISLSSPVLPFQLDDAARQPPKGHRDGGDDVSASQPTEESGDKKEKVLTVAQATRLDNRWIDLRTPANHAIFRLQSRVGQFYRNYFLDQGFVEIHTPKITPGVSEGGSQVFKFGYFNGTACLAQSPQLYKQMAVISDLFKVFEIGPVFRAEDSNTHRHMCEFVGLDFEMEIKEHYHEVLKVLGDAFVSIFDNLTTHCKAELEAVNKQFPFEPLQYRRETLIFSFQEAVKMLREAGVDIKDHDDFSTAQEKILGGLVKAKYQTDFYIVDQYPLTVRPFYTMPSSGNPGYTNSYDVFLRGEEITSGAQRIHEVELLKKRALECGIPLSNIQSYLESFKYGAYPHGGAGIGLERVVMLYLGLDNIRKTSMFPRTPNRCAP